MEEMIFAATCLFGLESQLGKEIDSLGCRRLSTIDGRVIFSGAPGDGPRCNIRLRYAERLYAVVGRFSCTSFEELFCGVKSLEWEYWIGRDDAFPVSGHSVKSTLYSIPDCQAVIKKAIADRLGGVYGLVRLPETGKTYKIEFFILKDDCMMMIDLSGVALHKRGYRPVSSAAPLRETLAAGLADISRPCRDVLFWDPMCGSGTIAIEAAMQLANIAPGVNRTFISQDYPQFTAGMWKDAFDEARCLADTNACFEVRASDIDPACVDIATENCRRAGVDRWVHVFRADALGIKKEDRKATIVTNPPYGERLLTPQEAQKFYRQLGKSFSDLFPWHIYILTSDEEFERHFARKADKVRKLYNGMIKCFFYQYFRSGSDSAPKESRILRNR